MIWFPSGKRGPAGVAGAKGVQGERGVTGPQGPQGRNGTKGDKGDKGKSYLNEQTTVPNGQTEIVTEQIKKYKKNPSVRLTI